MAAIKSMAALFTAFDRPNYQKLIPKHIVDMLTIPEELHTHLAYGGFTVSITGRACHFFDDPDCQVLSPKSFERQHRDQTNPVPDNHCCDEFTMDMLVPPKWRESVLAMLAYRLLLGQILTSLFS